MNRGEVDAFFGSNFLSEWRGFNAVACCGGGCDRFRDDFRRRLWSRRSRHGRFGDWGGFWLWSDDCGVTLFCLGRVFASFPDSGDGTTDGDLVTDAAVLFD